MRIEVEVAVRDGLGKKPPPKSLVFLTDEVAKELATYIKKTIEDRSARGISSDGKPFAPYSPNTPGKAPGEKPDLKESGELFKSFTYAYSKSLKRSVKFWYKASYAKYVHDIRPFIGLSPDDEKGMQKILDKAFDQFFSSLKGG